MSAAAVCRCTCPERVPGLLRVRASERRGTATA
jgi:hypothetical protein